MSKGAFPHPLYQSGWDAQKQRISYEQTGVAPGMTVGHYYLGCILGGLASNPTTMLNMEDHLEYAIRLADLAEKKTDHWIAY